MMYFFFILLQNKKMTRIYSWSYYCKGDLTKKWLHKGSMKGEKDRTHILKRIFLLDFSNCVLQEFTENTKIHNYVYKIKQLCRKSDLYSQHITTAINSPNPSITWGSHCPQKSPHKYNKCPWAGTNHNTVYKFSLAKRQRFAGSFWSL